MGLMHSPKRIATTPAMIWAPRISGRVKVLLISVGMVNPTPIMTGRPEPMYLVTGKSIKMVENAVIRRAICTSRVVVASSSPQFLDTIRAGPTVLTTAATTCCMPMGSIWGRDAFAFHWNSGSAAATGFETPCALLILGYLLIPLLLYPMYGRGNAIHTSDHNTIVSALDYTRKQTQM